MAELLGVLEIIPHEIGRVLLSGGGAGAEVENGGDVSEARQRGHQLVGFEVIGVAEWHEIAPFLIAAEDVHEDEVVETALIKRPDEGTADEAGGSGDEDFIAGLHGR